MPDASKNGNPSDASNLKNGSVAGVSSEIERKQQIAASYDDGVQRAVAHTADFSRHADTVSSGYSAGTDAIGVSNPAANSAQDAEKAAIPPSGSNSSVPNSQETFGSSFGDSRSEQDAFKTGMDSGIDRLGQAGVTRSSEFGTDISASVQVDTCDAFSGSYDTGRTGFDQPTGGSGRDFSLPQTQQVTPAIAAQPIQPVSGAFNSRMEQQGSDSPFSGGADRNAAARRNMMTSIDGVEQAGIAGSRDFIEGTAVSVQPDARDSFSGTFDTGKTGFDQPTGGLKQNSGSQQGGQQSFGSPSPMDTSNAPAEDKADFVSEAAGFGSHQPAPSSWASADMFAGGHAKDVHLSKRIQENLDNSKAAYSEARQGYAAAEKDVLETLGASGWSSGDQTSAFSDSAARAESFKNGLGAGVDSIERAGVSDSHDFGFVAQAEYKVPSGMPARHGSHPEKTETSPSQTHTAEHGSGHAHQTPDPSGSESRAETFKGKFEASADAIDHAGISDARDFGFMSQAEREAEPSVPKPTAYRAGKESPAGGAKYADAPEDVRNAARNVVAKGEDVRKTSDEMVATHREVSEFITKAEKRAQTVANFKSAAANAVVNSAVASIGDDSVSGTAVRSSARAAVAAGRSIKASRAAGKQVGARSFFLSSAETSKAAILALDDDGSLDGLDKVDEAARAGRYVRGKAKDFKNARAKAKGGSKSQLMSQAEKRAARTSGDAQRASFSNSMQRRSMSIAKAKAAAGEIADANEKANLISKLVSGLANAGKQALQSLAALVQGIGSFLSGLFGSIAAALGSSVLAVIAVVVLLIVLFIVALFCDPSQATVQGLNETETQVATFFREKGLDDVQIAAIMGNMYGESGMHAGSEEGGGTNANGIGLCQWTNGRHTNLVNYANSVGKSWTDVGVQLDFFWDHDKWQSNWWSGYHINTYDHSPESMSEDPPSGSYVEGSKRGFLAATDVKDAVRQFLYGWEVAGIPRLKVRYDAAERYLEALQNGGDADGDHGANGGAPQIAGATARQQAIVNSAYATPTPGQGLCAAWVSNVFRNAGYGFYGGNACDMCRSWCHSSNRNELKVGMIIADVSHPGTGSAGLTYGHVGIYIGNNKVMSNEGPITVKSLDAFIRFYGAGTGCRWGWLGGIDLSQ